MDTKFGYTTRPIGFNLRRNICRFLSGFSCLKPYIKRIISTLQNINGYNIEHLCECSLPMHPFETQCIRCVAKYKYGIYFDDFIDRCACRTIAFFVDLGDISVYPPHGGEIYTSLDDVYSIVWYGPHCYPKDDHKHINELDSDIRDFNRRKLTFLTSPPDKYDRFNSNFTYNINLTIYQHIPDIKFDFDPNTSLIVAYDIFTDPNCKRNYICYRPVCKRGLQYSPPPNHKRKLLNISESLHFIRDRSKVSYPYFVQYDHYIDFVYAS